MATLVTRSGKGSPLTHDEVDANFNNLNTDKLESADLTAGAGISISGTTITNSDPDQTVSITGLGIASVSGTYPSFDVSVDALQSSDIGSTVQAYDANLTSFVDAFTLPTTDGTNGQALATNASGTLSFIDVASDPTLGTLTKSFASGETASVSLSSSVSPTAVVAVTKEVGQVGVSSKGAWDVASDASNYELYNEAPATSLTLGAWDVSTASFSQSFSVSSQDQGVHGVFFKPDGTKMYVVGQNNDAIYEYNLSTAWDISAAIFSQSFSVASQEISPREVSFKPDGLKMYLLGESGDDVNEYSLSTAWDISTASYSQVFSVASQDTAPQGMFFKPDGTKMYIVGQTNDRAYEYDLSTAWDISTASFLQDFSISAQETNPRGLSFKPDGTKMYITGNNGQDVNEYDLSTAWDVSTASYLQVFSVSAQETYPTGVFFKPDGTKMYIIGLTYSVYEYDVSGPLVLGTGSFSSSDVGKRIFVDDGGEAILTATDGSYSLVSAFGASSYTSGNWSLSGLDVDATNGITLSKFEEGLWDVSTASYVQAFSLGVQESSPQGIFFKTDGTKMYAVGFTGDDVNEYTLSTAWDISTASYSQVFYVGSQELLPTGVFFKPDGTKMYIVGANGDRVNEYTLSTAWDVSTASYSNNFSVSAQESYPSGVFFKPDGTKMYVVGASGQDVNEYNLSTAWAVSTASYVQNFSVSAQETIPEGVFFKPDGTKMYIIGDAGDDVNEYNLSTAWDISTASYFQNFSVAAQETSTRGMFFRSDGTKMYVVGASGGASGRNVNEYDLGSISQPTAQYLPALTSSEGQISSTYWTDINSMTADDADNDGEVYYAVSTDDRTTWSIAKASDGVRNIVRNNGGTWEYNSATGLVSAWDISTASYSQSLSVNAEEAAPSGVFFKPDGFKMYIVGFTGDEVNEYDLSTAWDISTASFLQNFSVSAQETGPAGLFFKSDGLKMYIIGQSSGDAVYEYNLSTAWDVSTASYNQNFSVSAQHTVPQDVFFKSDGTKMYVVGNSTDRVSEYNLSTAWDISTASYSQYFSVAAQEAGPRGLFFKSDGSKMYIAGDTGDEVNEYNLSTAWDVSTASFLQNFSVASQDTSPQGVFFKPDGFRMYVVGTSGDAIYEYDIGEQGFTTSETWNSATTNNEFAALAEALGASASNQMDKAQIDGVTDGSHFTLGDTLDLAIVPYLASAGTAPTSDGLSINYDAAALNKGAILGTDYDYDVPETDVVRITSLATQNLKVRIV